MSVFLDRPFNELEERKICKLLLQCSILIVNIYDCDNVPQNRHSYKLTQAVRKIMLKLKK